MKSVGILTLIAASVIAVCCSGKPRTDVDRGQGWSTPLNGLSARVFSTRSYWIPGETPEVVVQVRNVSETDIAIRPLRHEGGPVNVSFRVQLPGRPETGHPKPVVRHAHWAPPEPITLRPGESAEISARVHPSPRESEGALAWEVVAELKSPSHPIEEHAKLWRGTIAVSTAVKFHDLTKLPAEQLVSFLSTDYPAHPLVRSELARRWQLAPPIAARPIQYSQAVRSANDQYVVFFRGFTLDGRGFPTMRGEHLMLVRSDGHVMWSRPLNFADFAAVGNEGSVVVAEWLKSSPQIRVRIISADGDDVGSYEAKPDEAFLKQWRGSDSGWVRRMFSNITAMGISPDGTRVYFATVSEREKPRLRAVDRRGVLQWEAILDEVFPSYVGSALRSSPDGRYILVADTCRHPSNGFVVFTNGGRLVHTSRELGESAAFSFEGNVLTVTDRQGTRKVVLSER